VHFLFQGDTGQTGTVGIPAAATPRVNGTPIVPGDEIGVFTPAGACVGATTWTGANTYVCVNGMDPDFKIFGIVDGMTMSWRIWKKAEDQEYYADATYLIGNSVYHKDCIYVMSAMEASEPLPVELSRLEASVMMGRHVEIKWRTESETNCYGFRINRKEFDGPGLEFVALVKGAGTSTTPNEYTIYDEAPKDGKFQYQVVQVDLDASETYYVTNVVEISTVVQPKEEKKSVPYWVIALGLLLIAALAYALLS
jgi:hypothetical protein